MLNETTVTADPPLKQARRRKRAPLPSTQGRMLRRLNQLRALARGRARRGEPFGDLHKWAMLLADCMLYHSKGCDHFSLRDALRPVPALWEALDEDGDTVMDAVHAVTRMAERRGPSYRPIRTRTAGWWLELTAEECRRHGITTMRPIDPQPAAEARARRQQEDRDRKREARRTTSAADKRAAKRAERERGRRRRAAKNARPHAESRSRKQPWKLEGIGRSWWYERQRTKTSTPPAPDKNVRPSHSYYVATRTDETVRSAPAGRKTNEQRCQRRERPPAEKGRVAEHGNGLLTAFERAWSGSGEETPWEEAERWWPEGAIKVLVPRQNAMQALRPGGP